MMFFIFLCQRLQCVRLSETVLESCTDNDNFNPYKSTSLFGHGKMHA